MSRSKYFDLKKMGIVLNTHKTYVLALNSNSENYI